MYSKNTSLKISRDAAVTSSGKNFQHVRPLAALSAAALILLVAILLSACSGAGKLTGYWRTSNTDPDNADGFLVVYSDHTYVTNGGKGTYSANSNSIELTNGKNKIKFTYTLEDNVLTLSRTEGSISFVKMSPDEIAQIKQEDHLK